MGVTQGQFRVEELNPFMEWHHHAKAGSLGGASKAAMEISQKIGRRTRVISIEENMFDLFDP